MIDKLTYFHLDIQHIFNSPQLMEYHEHETQQTKTMHLWRAIKEHK